MRSIPRGRKRVYGRSNLLEGPDDGVDEVLGFIIIVQVTPVEIRDRRS